MAGYDRPTINVARVLTSQRQEWTPDFLAAATTKASAWAHERESRALHEPGPRVHPENMLSGVILGARISKDDERWVRAMLEEGGLGGIDILRIRPGDTSFELSVVPDVR